jgi:hypothetical protein
MWTPEELREEFKATQQSRRGEAKERKRAEGSGRVFDDARHTHDAPSRSLQIVRIVWRACNPVGLNGIPGAVVASRRLAHLCAKFLGFVA